MDYWLYISLFAAAIAVYAMIDVLLAKISTNKKMVWFPIIVLFPVVGPLIYLLKKRAMLEANQ